MIGPTSLLKRTVADGSERDNAMRAWALVMAQLSADIPLRLSPPFEIEVTAHAALGGKTVVVTTITREFART